MAAQRVLIPAPQLPVTGHKPHRETPPTRTHRGTCIAAPWHTRNTHHERAGPQLLHAFHAALGDVEYTLRHYVAVPLRHVPFVKQDLAGFVPEGMQRRVRDVP